MENTNKLPAGHSKDVIERYTFPIKTPARPILGRDKEIGDLLAVFYAPEVSNAILIGEAGSGKTMLVQGLAAKDKSRIYLEVNMEAMIAESENNVAERLASQLRLLFDAVAAYQKAEHKEIVLFIDEFHKVVQLSAAAVESLKPLLADSGTRGIRMIAATTYAEFEQYIKPNQPLVERLERITISPPNRETTINILSDMAKKYGVMDAVPNPSIFVQIYETTERYVPSDSQPRKSILLLDKMIGKYRCDKEVYQIERPIDLALLADVAKTKYGININFRVNPTTIKEKLDSVVLAQQYATSKLADSLQTAVANLHDKNRPMANFLFAGPTGVGKTETAKQLAKIMFEDSHALIRFDMSQYASDDSFDDFRHSLTSQIWARPHSILLLDEIEKASKPVTHLLLQVLDDGRLVDDNNRIVPFLNCYIILTSNIGTELFANSAHYQTTDTGIIKNARVFEKQLRDSIINTSSKKFPPELLGRVNAIVPFQPLSDNTRRKITLKKLETLCEKIETEYGMTLQIDSRLITYIVEDLSSNETTEGGARNIANIMGDVLTPKIAKYLNYNRDRIEKLRIENKVQNNSEYPIICVWLEGSMRSDDPDILVSTAEIQVGTEKEKDLYKYLKTKIEYIRTNVLQESYRFDLEKAGLDFIRNRINTDSYEDEASYLRYKQKPTVSTYKNRDAEHIFNNILIPMIKRYIQNLPLDRDSFMSDVKPAIQVWLKDGIEPDDKTVNLSSAFEIGSRTEYNSLDRNKG